MGDLIKLERDERKKNENEADVVSSTKWMVGIFCDSCYQPWAELAPCPHCGIYARPVSRTFRRVVRGHGLMPWTWEKGYEFTAEDQKEQEDTGPQVNVAVR